MQKLDEATIKKLKDEHGDNIHRLVAADETVVVKLPSRGMYRRFRDAASNERKRSDSLETLARDCVIWPDMQTFDEILERKPALADMFGGKVLELAGGDEEATAKKL